MASESVVRRPSLPGFVLPYGFVQSPLLASLALDRSKLGSCLRSLYGNSQFNVSIYVDDIIVSCDDIAALNTAALNLEAAANSALFPISHGKKEGPGACITAFNIELSHKAMLITPKRMAEFSVVYHATTNPNCREGIESYIDSVNSGQIGSL
jgi:hypothetical protein